MGGVPGQNGGKNTRACAAMVSGGKRIDFVQFVCFLFTPAQLAPILRAFHFISTVSTELHLPRLTVLTVLYERTRNRNSDERTWFVKLENGVGIGVSFFYRKVSVG